MTLPRAFPQCFANFSDSFSGDKKFGKVFELQSISENQPKQSTYT